VDVSSQSDNVKTIDENAEDICQKKMGLGVNAKKTTYMILSHKQYVGQNYRC
jgi:hypothetical protein